MKNSTIKAFTVITLTSLLFISMPKQTSAQSTFTVYMDSITILDTIYTCSSYDTLEFIPNAGTPILHFWRVSRKAEPNYIEDTVLLDTLYLPGNFEGQVGYNAYDGVNSYGNAVDIKPLTLYSIDKSGTCGSLVQLIAICNFSGSGETNFTWSPASGLSDPAISNPTTLVRGDTEYTVTANVPNGCIISKTIDVVIMPMSNPSICIVGVDSSNKNVIYWEPVPDAIDSILIYKESNITDNYIKIGSVGNNDPEYFIDQASFPFIQSNKYKISIKDSCGIESEKSLPHKTIHLSMNQGLNDSWNLIWEHYEGFPVQTYFIYRGSDSTILELIGSTAGSSNQFTDYEAPAGSVFYQVEVINQAGCNFSDLKSTQALVNTSRSNIAFNIVSGVKELTDQPGLYSVYPNPLGDKLYVESKHGEFAGGNLEITDLAGKRISRIELNQSKTEINCSDLRNGMYILKIKTGNGIFTHKIVKN